MDTDDKKLIDVVFGRDAIRQTSVIHPNASPEGRRYNPEHLKDGGLGLTLTVDLRAMRGRSMTPQQRLAVHRVILGMAINVLEHDYPVLRNPASNVIPIGQQPAETQNHIEPAAPEDTDKGLPILDLFGLEIDPEVIASVPRQVVFERRIIPVQREGGVLVIATSDPLDYFALDNLRFILAADVEQVLVTKSALDAAIEKHYGKPPIVPTVEPDDIALLAEQAALQTAAELGMAGPKTERERAAASTPIVKLVNLVLLQGIKAKVTKIIVAAEEDQCVIRMEIEGTLYDMQSPPAHLGQAFIDRLRLMADIHLHASGHQQKGRIDLQVGGRPITLDVSFIPLSRGDLAILDVLCPKNEKGEGEAPIGAKT